MAMRAADPPTVVVTDIEGTTTPIAFVHRVLFPYARAALPDLLASRSSEPAVVDAMLEVERLAGGTEPLAQLLAWMDQDAKVTPLKTLQGIAWRDGYATGLLQGELYGDVAPGLRAWHAAGVRLAVYSSGSEAAQRLIFGHSPDGDLTGLFDGFFDTRIGAKLHADSYGALAARLRAAPAELLFLSDVEAELDAALAAGLRTCQLVRPQDGTQAGARHAVAADFDDVSALFGLDRFASRVRSATPAA